MNPLLEQFVAEARDLLQSATDALLALEKRPTNGPAIEALFRAVHTLKGNAGLFDFPHLAQLLHALEDLLDHVRAGTLGLSSPMADSILGALDAATALVDGVAQMGAEPDLDLGTVREELTRWATEPRPSSPPDAVLARSDGFGVVSELATLPEDLRQAVFREMAAGQPLYWIAYHPAEMAFFQGDDPFLLARRTPGILWGTVLTPASWPPSEAFDPYRCVVRLQILSAAPHAELAEHFRYVRDQIQMDRLDRWALVIPSGPHDPEAVDGAFLDAARQALAHRDLPALIHLAGETRRHIAEDSWQASALRWIDWVATMEEPREEVLAALLESYATGSVAGRTAHPRQPTRPEPSAKVPSTSPLPDAAAGGPGVDAMEWLKVASVKVNRLVDLVGELVVAHNALPYFVQRLETESDPRRLAREFKAQYAILHRLTESLQDAVMQLRMTPLSTIFQRFPRMVRDLSRRLDKPVDLSVDGEDTEIDKHVAEQLAEPLVHLLRNSLDHGIESPQDRKAAGKPERGHIALTAQKMGDHIVIEVADDGRGIDPQRVKRRAYERGLVEAEQLERLSDQETLKLILLPGFSTADTVSDLSGRGVGMDAVRHAVEKVGGHVAVESTVGEGTRIRLTLPVTMAVHHILVVESAGQQFGMPLETVAETVRIAPSYIRVIKQQPTAVLRGQLIPLVSLNQALGDGRPQHPNAHGEYAVLVARWGRDRVGLIVDGFRGTLDVVVKPLPRLLEALTLYEGTAVLGDGTVLMVLNPKELVRCLSWSKTS